MLECRKCNDVQQIECPRCHGEGRTSCNEAAERDACMKCNETGKIPCPDCKSTITLAVSGGVVSCVSNPTNVEVVIRDYDIEGMDCPNVEHDDYGDYIIIHFSPDD